MKLLTRKYWHRVFEIGIVIKGLNGIWEIGSGLLFLFLSKATLDYWLGRATRRELLEDRHDVFINFLVHAFQNVSIGAQHFVAIYLLFHGFLNIFLVVQLHRGKHWAYIATMGLTMFFVTYQIYRISIHHSLFLTVVTIFDVFFVLLTWHEFAHHRERHASAGDSK